MTYAQQVQHKLDAVWKQFLEIAELKYEQAYDKDIGGDIGN